MAVISCLTAIRSRALNDRSGVDSGQRTGAASVRGPATRRATARRRCAAVAQQIGDHTFRATGITTYLKNGAMLENARRWPIMLRRAPRSCTAGDEITSA